MRFLQQLGRTLVLLVILLPFSGTAQKKTRDIRDADRAVVGTGQNSLWQNPEDIASRDLYYGVGGQQHQPQGPFAFLREDSDGTNPKFDVRDRDGVKWKVKLGVEARPETAASRLVWAAGYFANEDYLVPVLRVDNMKRLKRGQNLIERDGLIRDARLKRMPDNRKKIGIWSWKDNPFIGTREFNGLRVMMALINNWDLKDSNNAVYEYLATPDVRRNYTVSDLGASFGTTGLGWTKEGSRGNLRAYSGSTFIRTVARDYVDFNVPTRPALIHLFNLPAMIDRLSQRQIGLHIPRADARWVGALLARLSARQIADVFRSGGYSPEEVEGFSRIVRDRIAQLNGL
jgi:hypothetical protein